MQGIADVIEERLHFRRQRSRRKIGVAERQYSGPQRVAARLVGDYVAEFSQRVEAAPHGCARYARAMAQLRDGEVPALLREGADDRQPTGERRHEVRIAGQAVNLRRRRDEPWFRRDNVRILLDRR